MKTLLTTITLTLFLLCSSTGIGNDTNVYICVSKNSVAYHYTSNCRGLSNCKHEIRKVTLSDAKNEYGRRLCGWED